MRIGHPSPADAEARPRGPRVAAWAALAIVALAGCSQQPARRIAYIGQSSSGYWQIWTVLADGTGARQVSAFDADVTRLSWFPDGDALLANLQDGRVLRVPADGAAPTVLLRAGDSVVDAVISPDGTRIAYSLSTASSKDDNDIWVADISGGEPGKLTSMPWLQHQPVWTRDGKQLVFLSGSASGQQHDIWRVDVATRASEQLTVGNAYHFDIAVRDDGVIAYSGNQGGHYDLWLRHGDGGTEQLTDDAALDAQPAWSHDGDTLVFESNREVGHSELWRLDLESRRLDRLTTSDGARQPAWQPGTSRSAP